MDGRKHNDSTLTCAHACAGLQDYLDGTLDKNASLSLFLHLRSCEACSEEHDRLGLLFRALEDLPQIPVPEDFDARILESIPLAAYREMEPLRRERVPVFLEESFLPAWVRSPRIRLAGLGATLAAVAAVTFGGASEASLAGALGAVPEILVRCQGWARHATMAVRRSES